MSKLNNTLVISFDLIRKGENVKSLAISSILAYLKKDEEYGIKFKVNHLPINMCKSIKNNTFDDLKRSLVEYDFSDYNYIAISAYIWNEYLLKDLLRYLKNERKFVGKIILGGHQISYSDKPENDYKDCDYFISGFAEKSLLEIIKGETNSKKLNSVIDLSQLPSPYLSNELPIEKNQKSVRLETKRGCPYKCNFCAHRDLTYNRVYKFSLERIYKELRLFKEMNVGKINVIDPIFNAGKEYIDVLKEIIRLDIKSKISIQTRFETIVGDKGKQFLDLCEKININLEFGLQTSNRRESEIINRKNNPKKIALVMRELNKRKINYEISLIYGLPTQTVKSFKESIDFVKNNGCNKLTAFSLMLLKGTELFSQKEEYKIVEKEKGDFNIPTVVQTTSFTEVEWLEMQKIAEVLNQNTRV